MRAVVIKKSSREKSAGFQEMGTLRCDGCGGEFFLGHNPASADRWVEKSKQSGWKRSLPRSTTAIRNTPTESNCLSKVGR